MWAKLIKTVTVGIILMAAAFVVVGSIVGCAYNSGNRTLEMRAPTKEAAPALSEVVDVLR